MTTITTIAVHSELALASYAKNLFKDISGRPYLLALEDGGNVMSPRQAQRFAAEWRVVDQFNHANGLSATIFQRTVNGSATGPKYLAVRGTEFDAGDLLANALLALGVSARLNPQYNALKAQIDLWLTTGGALDGQSFTVAGHSLGGYLAAALKQDYGAQISAAYLFNAPGSGGLVGNIAGLVAGVFSQSSPGANGIWNIKASEGLSLIGGLGSQSSAQIPAQIEEAGGVGFDNHSIVRLTDALAVQALYATLVPSLTSAQLNVIVDASGNPANQTLESALDALRTLLGVSNSTTTVDNREEFYTNLYALTTNTAFTAIAGANGTQLTVLAGKKAIEDGGIVQLAQDASTAGLATRYALKALNPFALIGADYSVLNADGSLNLYNAATQPAGMTAEYLADRADFLERKLWFSTEDISPVDPLAGYTPGEQQNFANTSDSKFFLDRATGYDIRRGELFNSTRVYAFGGGETNVFIGQLVADRFYSGAGTDLLIGGKGDGDYMEGGPCVPI